MIEAVVTDIEGTTSSLSFVKDILFPYARRHIGRYVERHAQEPGVADCLREIRAMPGNAQADLGQLIEQLHTWIDEDRKVTPLKTLQGLVWEDGYRSGAFSGHVHQDAVTALRNWWAQGLRLYVYSSGSVHAQKLLFAHTAYGDLTALFSGFYDTRVGPKVDPASYRCISDEIGRRADRILFLSDAERELDAAREAGMQTCQLAREGETQASASHRWVKTFAEIDLQSLDYRAVAGTA